ncbi:hypothetical protein KM043_009063 [Ampulex compressa]|nr:hypothetical protein KM043_009063 [Ampulex compressa]
MTDTDIQIRAVYSIQQRYEEANVARSATSLHPASIALLLFQPPRKIIPDSRALLLDLREEEKLVQRGRDDPTAATVRSTVARPRRGQQVWVLRARGARGARGEGEKSGRMDGTGSIGWKKALPPYLAASLILTAKAGLWSVGGEAERERASSSPVRSRGPRSSGPPWLG